jgi:hypothetical protein
MRVWRPGDALGGSPLSDGEPWVRVPLAIARDDPRIEALALVFAEKFRPFCAGMPADAFARLTRHAAWIRLRWPYRTAEHEATGE